MFTNTAKMLDLMGMDGTEGKGSFRTALLGFKIHITTLINTIVISG